MFNLATFILSSLMAIQSWTVELPFKTVGLPNETALDHYGQEVRVTFTMDEQTLEDIPDESTLVSILEQQFLHPVRPSSARCSTTSRQMKTTPENWTCYSAITALQMKDASSFHSTMAWGAVR